MAITQYGMKAAAMLIGTSTSGATSTFNFIGIGTDSTSAASSDVKLGSQVSSRVSAFLDMATTAFTDDTLKLEKDYWTFGSSNVLREIGVFDSATTAGSCMLCRSVFAAITVDSTVTLATTVNVRVLDKS
jgi:hypothetical protein